MKFFNKFDKLKVKYKDNPGVKISFLLGVISILFIFIGGSYAFIFKSVYTQSINTISAGTLVVTLENTTSVISVNNAIPTPDDIALKDSVTYDFTLKNTGSINAKYKLSLINSCTVGSSYTVGDSSVKADVCIPTQYVKAGISKDGEDFKVVKVDSDGNIILDDGVLGKLKSSSYKLKLWLDYDTPNSYNVKDKNTIMSYKIQLYIEQTTEGKLDISGANAPALTSNMIPVYYDSTSNVWKKADENNLNKSYKWYDYDNKLWANAVTVTSTNRETYLKASAGTEISMDDINTMWVWIPRYTYTYLNTNTPQEIKIKFESGTNSSGTIKCTDAVTGTSSTSETCTDTTNNGLVAGISTYTHPAFWWDKNDDNIRTEDEELTGIWVGKFEISSGQIIKPNVASLIDQRANQLYTGIYNMRNSGNAFGFNTSDETHMIKNMEWGAVAYLSHSKYGINKEIAINSASTYTTGCGPQSDGSIDSGTTCNAYNTALGQSASTTGNVYGIYDMSGGAHECVMGNMVNSSGTFYSSSVGFSTTPATKYYDKYSYGTSQTEYTRGKLGDATKEMAPTGITGNWYSNSAFFPFNSYSWFLRGGNCYSDASAGAFNFKNDYGYAVDYRSSRAVLGVLD